MSNRTLTVNHDEGGRTIVDWLRARLSLSRPVVLKLLQERKVRLAGTPCSNPTWRVLAGQRVEVEMGQRPTSPPRNRSRNPVPVIRHLDDDLIVVDKPSGLTTMRHADEAAEFGSRGQRYLPATLQDLLPNLIATHTGGKPGQVRAVHRLDKETSGLIVFARHLEAESHLGQQFRARDTERLYRAIVRGKAVEGRIESWLLRDRGDGRRGSGERGEGQHAVTHVSVIEALGDFTLVECELETGRTHQVRIHLGEAGTPLCGERIYDRPLHGKPVPDGSGIERIALHAATLGLTHPTTRKRMSWKAPMPEDMEGLLRRLRGRKM